MSRAWPGSAQLKGILSLVLALVSVLFFLAQERRGGWWRLALATRRLLAVDAGQGHGDNSAGGAAGLCLVAARPNRAAGSAASPAFPPDRGGHGGHGGLDPTCARAGVPTAFLSQTAGAGCVVWFYLWKLIWPLHLCFIYPGWRIDDRNALSYLPGMLLATVLSWRGGDAVRGADRS